MTIVKVSPKHPSSIKAIAPSHASKRLKAITKKPSSKKGPTLVDESTESSYHKQELGEDESTQSSKS